MAELSQRASYFLSKQERLPSTVLREDIIDSFKANEVPVFEPLIEFQQKYSGYIFYAGLAPIHFGLLQGDGGYPKRTNAAIIEFCESRNDTSEYEFTCASTLYQMEFGLDEHGRYYEDHEIVASSFHKLIEHLAVRDEFKHVKGFTILKQNEPLKIEDLDKKLALRIIPEASDEYTLWFKNESIYMTQRKGLTTIIGPEVYKWELNEIINK